MPVTTAARETGTDIPHERLAKDNIVITKPGYVYIYLSNENRQLVEVFYDDFKVEHIKCPIVQQEDYYPFGLVMDGKEIDDEPYQVSEWCLEIGTPYLEKQQEPGMANDNLL